MSTDSLLRIDDLGALQAKLRWGQVTKEGLESESLTVTWCLGRNCSMWPAQVALAFGLICALSLGIALFFWVQGVYWVAPFSMLEVALLGGAWVVYARGAGDVERIRLTPDCLTVEWSRAGLSGCQEWKSAWGSVGCDPSGSGLIVLKGCGCRAEVGRLVRPEVRAAVASEIGWVLRWIGAGPGERKL
jgi:uncharacterized membrane protein